jgi:hypothetical protein
MFSGMTLGGNACANEKEENATETGYQVFMDNPYQSGIPCPPNFKYIRI